MVGVRLVMEVISMKETIIKEIEQSLLRIYRDGRGKIF